MPAQAKGGVVPKQYDVTYELICSMTVEADDEAEALSIVNNSSANELFADAQSCDAYPIEAHLVE